MDAGGPPLRAAVEQGQVDSSRIEPDLGDQLVRLIEVESEVALVHLGQFVLETEGMEPEGRLATAADEEPDVGQATLEKLAELQHGIDRHELEVVDHQSNPAASTPPGRRRATIRARRG